jgi:hypothetical protein
LLPPVINQRSSLALAALLAASCAAPVALAQPAAEWQPQLVALDESGDLNQPNYRFDATHTAAGYWQITDTSWRAFAPMAGTDLTRCPTALSCSFDDQGAWLGLCGAGPGICRGFPTIPGCVGILVPLAASRRRAV